MPLISAVLHHLVSELDLIWWLQVSKRNVTNTRELKTIVKKKRVNLLLSCEVVPLRDQGEHLVH